jgi:hypothetical protein
MNELVVVILVILGTLGTIVLAVVYLVGYYRGYKEASRQQQPGRPDSADFKRGA